MNPQQVAGALGVLSLGLGLTEIIVPGRLARFLGADEHNALVRGYGARELLAGAGLLAQPGARTAWLWFRVAGDALDLAALGMVESRTAAGRKRTANALALVTAITVADVLTARALMQAARAPSRRRDLPLWEAR